MCLKCEKYSEQFSCGANKGSGECDCPKCQGICSDLTNSFNSVEEWIEWANKTKIDNKVFTFIKKKLMK